jgi:hypothetical protein
MLTAYSSTVSHEMISPLKCTLEIAQSIKKRSAKNSENDYEAELIITTASILLN